MNKQKKFSARNNGITLIALVITIIVLLILAGVTINTLFDNENAIEKAAEAKEEDSHGNVKDQIQLEITNYQLAKGLGETNATSSIEYLSGKEYFKEEYNSETESYTIKSDKISNVPLGKGTDKTSGDVYVVEKDVNDWKLKYYKESNDENPRILLSLSVSNTNVKPDKVPATNVSELVAGDYVDYVYTDKNGDQQTIHCIVLYDKNDSELADVNDGIQIITAGCLGNKILQNGESYVETVDDYDNSSICQKFSSGKMTRVVGSDPKTGYVMDYDSLNDWNDIYEYIDDFIDYKRLKQKNILILESSYWYNVSWYIPGEYSGLGLLGIGTNGDLCVNVLQDQSGTNEYIPTYIGGESGLRLVFKLKDELPIISGTGEQDTPYQLVEA